MISAECAAHIAATQEEKKKNSAAQEEKKRQSRRKSTPSARPLSGPLARPSSGQIEELAPVRQHSLPHDVQHLCRRVSWLENFYEILYACQVPDLNIPFTVVYQYNRPYSAFYSEDGVLRKIESKDLDVPNPAIQTLAHNHQATNVLAELVPGPSASRAAVHKCSTGVEAMRVFSRDAMLQGDKDLVVEYQTAEDAENYLLFRSKEQNGIIQRFVQPITPKVISYRVYWTPHHTQIEAVCNNHLADAADLPVERRCCTFDGHQNDVCVSALNKAVQKKINAATDKIIAAVRRLMPRRVDIQMCILHFKASSGGRVWFLYCGSLRLLDGSDRPHLGGKVQIGATEIEKKRRLYAVTTDRPRTARAEEPQLPPAKGRAAQKRKGRECVVSGTFLGKDGQMKYDATFQDIMLHFLWHGLSSGFEKLGNKSAAKKAVQDEERVARMQKLLSGGLQVRRSLRHLLTGDPSCPLLFVRDPAAAQKAIDDDDLLRASYRLWNDTLTQMFALVVDNLVEESFGEKKSTAAFLQQVAPVCEDAFLELSTSLTKILMGADKSPSSSRTRSRAPKHDSSQPLQRGVVASQADKENMQNHPPASSKRTGRSTSCPPGKPVESPGAVKTVKFSCEVEEHVHGERGHAVGEFGRLRGEEAQELANHLMKNGAMHEGSFFGCMQGSRWRHPVPDGERFIRNEVNSSEFLYWFHLYASVGLWRSSPDTPALAVSRRDVPHLVEFSALSFRPGTSMTFSDLASFLCGVGLMPSRVSRASAAHVFQAVNKDHTVNDDEVRLLDSNEFVQYMKKLLAQVVCAERCAFVASRKYANVECSV